jgi:hypothetical protein
MPHLHSPPPRPRTNRPPSKIDCSRTWISTVTIVILENRGFPEELSQGLGASLEGAA